MAVHSLLQEGPGSGHWRRGKDDPARAKVPSATAPVANSKQASSR